MRLFLSDQLLQYVILSESHEPLPLLSQSQEPPWIKMSAWSRRGDETDRIHHPWFQQVDEQSQSMLLKESKNDQRKLH